MGIFSRNRKATTTEQRIDALCEQAEAADDAGDAAGAIALFGEAYALLPEPRTAQEDAVRVMASLGDVLYQAGRPAEALPYLQEALQSPGGTGNPFVWLRLGECHFDLGDRKAAGDALTSAYMLEGEEIFEEEDPRYREFLSTILLPPAPEAH